MADVTITRPSESPPQIGPPSKTAAHRRMRTRARARYKSWAGQGILFVILLTVLILSFATIALMFFLSLKDNGQIYGRFWSLPNPIRWENYRDGWLTMRRSIFNSLVYSLSSVVLVVFLSSLSGYVFARHRFPGKELIYVLILALLMIPGVLTLIPAFVLVRDLGLINTPWALILPWTAGGQVFGILLCRSFFATLPQELFDAAKVDGASEFEQYWRIALPLSWPILVTLAIMHLVSTYNDFLWPLLTISDPKIQVVTVALTQFTNEFGMVNWGPRMAAYAVASLPLVILFAFGMRYYVRGLTSGALKG
ncbi:MAG TPA: carbohydrate ABC transporter permease [Thermomicrobiales bacterium]|nr:carbohydrate ABC transporter permease [Thermomicrobiales bacterium]